ncbi:hypothetical protein PMALA_054010, partial [Plasmodium malariae]
GRRDSGKCLRGLCFRNRSDCSFCNTIQQKSWSMKCRQPKVVLQLIHKCVIWTEREMMVSNRDHFLEFSEVQKFSIFQILLQKTGKFFCTYASVQTNFKESSLILIGKRDLCNTMMHLDFKRSSESTVKPGGIRKQKKICNE